MKYKDYISVNENFQYSVNLQFDINNISKIKEYIPTKDGCELLNQYFNSVVNSKNRATTLIGPYGKGKSHLLLVLITLLNNYNNVKKKYISIVVAISMLWLGSMIRIESFLLIIPFILIIFSSEFIKHGMFKKINKHHMLELSIIGVIIAIIIIGSYSLNKYI